MSETPSDAGLLAEPPPGRHLVQFAAADDDALTRNLVRFAREGLRREEGIAIVATPERNAAVERELRDVRHARRRVLYVDARSAADLVRDCGPEPLFASLEAGLEGLRRAGADGFRVFGEVVGLLWRSGDVELALEVEAVAEPIAERSGATIFCGYPIDVFGEDFAVDDVEPLLCAHSHLLASGPSQRVDAAVERAMRDVLGTRAEGLGFLVGVDLRRGWPAIPRGEATILWLRDHLPRQAAEILGRAREYYRSA